MKVKELLKEVKDNRYTYHNLDKEAIKQYQKLYNYLKRHKEKKINELLSEVENGTGTMSKLLYDEELYLELVESNKKLQDLVEDLTLHPERYIHFSLLGSKTKGTTLSPKDERKLRKVLDTIQD